MTAEERAKSLANRLDGAKAREWNALIAFAIRAAESAEREACAALAEEQVAAWPAGAWSASPNAPYATGRRDGAAHIAAAIRAVSSRANHADANSKSPLPPQKDEGR